MLDARGTAVPSFLHWGADLGDLSASQLVALANAAVPAIPFSSVDAPVRSTVFPLLNAGWQGRQALSGHRAGAWDARPFELLAATVDTARGDGSAAASVTLISGLQDGSIGLRVVLDYELTAEGLLRVSSSLTNAGEDAYELAELSLVLPLPERASEVLDFSGHWSAERRPQRREMQQGAWMRETRHGRPGHDGPYLVTAGTPSFGFRAGEVWSVHLGWSGNQRVWVESAISGPKIVGVGELLAPGEVILAPGESYQAPAAYASWSGEGLDGMSSRYHRYLRRTRPARMAERQRPVILNTWEAVYFDHDETKLRELADLGAAVGAERFVLDDGWMNRRTDDTLGLGDWTVDAERWPHGLGALAEYVISVGLDFGLWVEPEMLNLNSDIAREHPEWVLADTAGAPALSMRNQYVLNLAVPEAFASVLAHLSALLEAYPISYLKWDHNRDLLVASAREQTLATYRLMDELQARHPGVEIESCASGGGRIDLGILERTNRVWPSDTNDSLERQGIYRWTTLLIPPELFGAHLGAATAHTTGRTHGLSFRFATALFGWAGIEWDLTRATPEEIAATTTWLAAYKGVRDLIFTGDVVRSDRTDPALWVHGIVARDASEALFSVAATGLVRDALPAPILFPGLDPEASYRVEPLHLGAAPRYFAVAAPQWLREGGVELPGILLSQVGIAAPPLAPDNALVLKLTRL